MRARARAVLLLLSPLAVILLLRLIAALLSRSDSVWVWVPFVLLYWAVVAIAVKLLAPPGFLKGVLGPPEGHRAWSFAAVVLGTGGVSYLFENAAYYRVPEYVAAGIVFSLINPFFEEIYWRKLFIDRFPDRPYAVALYSSALFAVMHYLTLGLISAPNWEPVIVPITFVAGLIWSIVYVKTKSLRYVILSHLLMDLFGFTALFIR